MRFLSVALISLVCVSAGQATVITVPADQPTIQAAIGSAANGDTILVSPGTYSENLDFLGKAVRVRSTAGPDSTVLQPASLTSPIVTFSRGESIASELTGFDITGSNGAPAVYVAGASPYIHHNVLQGHQGSEQAHALFRVTGQAHPRIEHNTLYNNAGHWGIIFSDADSINFINNTVDGAQRGLVIYSTRSVVKNNIVVNCTVYGFWNNGLSMTRTYNDLWNNYVNYYSTMPADLSDISKNPLFVGPGSGDYRLSSNSPCINAGDPGSPRDPDGSRIDMGAIWTCYDSTDVDGDGVIGCQDVCPTEYNPQQTDTDGDNIGDVCDPCLLDPHNDADGDGLCGNVDNCPTVANANQSDSDGDGVGDACDVCPGFNDRADADADGVPDGCDICPGFDDRADADFDGVPDGCDICAGSNDGLDRDKDGVPNGCDICEGFDDRLDSDLDGVPDGCDICPGFDDDLDTDGDTFVDGCDNCPSLYNLSQADNDGDGIGNVCDDCILDPDNDVDGDGVCGDVDNCPTMYNPSQADSDGDGVGDACVTTGTGEQGASLPADFALNQNYPNPFNPSTTVEFALPRPSHVRIEVYNIEGRMVRTLLDESRPPGYHTVVWDGKDRKGLPLSSGVYFCKLRSGAFAETRKMLLLK